MCMQNVITAHFGCSTFKIPEMIQMRSPGFCTFYTMDVLAIRNILEWPSTLCCKPRIFNPQIYIKKYRDISNTVLDNSQSDRKYLPDIIIEH